MHSARNNWSSIVWLASSVALALSGCAAGGYSNQDLRFQATRDTLYVLARNDGVSRNLCADLGGDVARAEGRLASADGKSILLGRVQGCYTVRHIIVCPDNDPACLAHEERHKVEGEFHR